MQSVKSHGTASDRCGFQSQEDNKQQRMGVGSYITGIKGREETVRRFYALLQKKKINGR
jgi:hypothetical protein